MNNEDLIVTGGATITSNGLLEIFFVFIFVVIGVYIRESFKKTKNPKYKMSLTKFILSCLTGFTMAYIIPEIKSGISQRIYMFTSILLGSFSYDILNIIFSKKFVRRLLKNYLNIDVDEKDNTEKEAKDEKKQDGD